MRQRGYGELVKIGIGAVLLLTATGCATSSDLERLEQGLGKKLEAQSKASQTEFTGLRMKLDTVYTAQGKQERALTRKLDEIWSLFRTEEDMVSTQIGMVQKQTKAMLDEMEMSEASTEQVRTELHSFQRAVSAISSNTERIASLVTNMGVELRSLLGAYSLEEAALRDRLKALEQLRRQLEPATVHQQPEILPAK